MAIPNAASHIAYLIGFQINDTPASIFTKLKTLNVKNALIGVRLFLFAGVPDRFPRC